MPNRKMLKYKMPDPGETLAVHMPSGAAIVHVGMQRGGIMAWASTSEGPLVVRRFETVGTGWDVREDAEYVGTVQDREYVWHVFEVAKEAR